MKLENVTAEIRPRGKWESVDLGVALTQRNYKAVMIAWSVTVLPLMLVLLGASYAWYTYEPFHFNSNDWGFTSWLFLYFPIYVIWWLKPVYERVPLYILSRSLFGEKISISELIRQWPKMIFKGAFTLLILRRVGTKRSFEMPISELEGLKGNLYKQRVSLLSRNGGDGASGLTVSSSILEIVGILTFYMFYAMLYGYQISNDFVNSQMEILWNSLFLESFSERSVASMMTFLVCYQVVISLLTPFYVGGGFAIYINSRTISEGWDIELAFKRLSDRLKKLRSGLNHTIMSFLTLFTVGFLLSSSTVEAADLISDSEAIERVVNADDFNLNTEQVPVPKGEGRSGGLEMGAGAVATGALGQVLVYLFIAFIVGFLIYVICKNLHVFKGGVAPVEQVKAPAAKSVLGMDVTPESLPKDIIQAASIAWNEGDRQLALSLFYRGSLVWMVNTAELPIIESDTESDCLEHARTISEQQVVQYFERLTNTWTAKAYGKIEPDDSAIDWLCHDWPFHRLTQVAGGKS